MIRERNVAAAVLAGLVGSGVAMMSPVLEAQSSSAVQTIITMLRAFGDPARSWSVAWPTSERFRVLDTYNGEAVLDRNTGLVWDTRRAGFTDLVWGVNVRDGFVDDYETFTLSLSTWCVRGGVDADEY